MKAHKKSLSITTQAIGMIAALVILLSLGSITSMSASRKTNSGERSRTIGDIEFAKIPGGCFKQGSNVRKSKKSGHRVCVESIWLGKYEVTQQQWKKVMGHNPSRFSSCGGDCPVEMVSWNDVQKFIKRFNAKHNTKARLPSESEWEYAARAGTTTKYYWGNSKSAAGEYAWYKGNFREEMRPRSPIHPVGKKKPNSWGLYDMSGNVLEWTQDCWNRDYKGAPTDGSPWLKGNCSARVLRGGAWGNDADGLQSAHRYGENRDRRNFYYGFRLVLPASPQ